MAIIIIAKIRDSLSLKSTYIIIKNIQIDKIYNISILPNNGIKTNPPRNVPTMLPKVFTEYNIPEVFPTLDKSFILILITIGDKKPINIDGIKNNKIVEIIAPILISESQSAILVSTNFWIKAIAKIKIPVAPRINWIFFLLAFLSAINPPI